MELVYLWVEDYKNIKKQGFNFSPRFKCHYDENTNELTIDENKEYVSIFPENINVTAIVGENGSGKSSVLINLIARERGFIVIEENNQFKIYNKNVTINAQLQQLHLTSQFNKNILYYTMDDNYLEATKRHYQRIHIERTVELYVQNYLKIQELNFEIFNFKPAFLFYAIIDENIIPEDLSSDELIESITHQQNSNSMIITTVIAELQQIKDKYFIYLLQLFGSISELFEQLNLIEKLHPKESYLTLQKDDVTKYLNKNQLPYLSEDEFNLIETQQNKKIPILDIEEIFGKDYIKLLFNPKVIRLEFNLFMNNYATFSSLSHGEKTVYGILLHTILFPKNDFLLFMDEPDNTLHPEWQRKFIYELIKQLKKYKKNAHLIITSHSPFILSDLPKENVIFLEKGEQVYPFGDGQQTFGANIHTLLSHGFFMQDGLMGEFAKSKINEIIEFHKQVEEENKKATKEFTNLKAQYENRKTQFWHIQNIVGDDYLKQVIKNHLIEIEKILLGKDGAKNAEVARVEAYLKSLKND